MSGRNRAAWLIAGLLVVLLLVAYTQLTLFVVQPIGAVPQGRTLVITRLNHMHFVDSADAFCLRTTGFVTLLCRGVALGAVGKNATILLRLPYSGWLYGISTGGRYYDR